MLDYQGMEILRVTNLNDEDLSFKAAIENENIGGALRIYLSTPLMKGKPIDIVVYFKTNDEQRAIDWIPKEDTEEGVFPMLYSQCEMINCRSIAPMQDTPSMKFTYDAQIDTDRPFKTFMSANLTREVFSGGRRSRFFSMPIAIPGYDIAIFSGDLYERQISKRVYLIGEQAWLDEAEQEY